MFPVGPEKYVCHCGPVDRLLYAEVLSEKFALLPTAIRSSLLHPCNVDRVPLGLRRTVTYFFHVNLSAAATTGAVLETNGAMSLPYGKAVSVNVAELVQIRPAKRYTILSSLGYVNAVAAIQTDIEYKLRCIRDDFSGRVMQSTLCSSNMYRS